MSDLIEKFRQSIRALKPEGLNGFEGLMAAVLSDVTKRSFAVASSGAQQGKDGQSTQDLGQIAFEAKRYDAPIPKDTIFTKIFEVAADKNSTVELYILGATCPVANQHLVTLRNGCRRLGIGFIAVAWQDDNLPELAVMLAMSADVTAEFMAANSNIAKIEIAKQLAAVKANPGFEVRSLELLTKLNEPSIAPAFALVDNKKWLAEAFSDKARAQRVFNQALSPSDTSIPGIIDRRDLRTNAFYRDHLKNRFVCKIIPVEVLEWTDLELEGLLGERGSSIADLDPSIIKSLRNPRIFGVATALFRADEIKEFGELSVDRLLFEHIKNGSAAVGTLVSPIEFTARIRAHADDIIQRIGNLQVEDLTEFETKQLIFDRFVITSAGRFFEISANDPLKHTLKDEGLPLALGLALLGTARNACQKGRSVQDALSKILDPIIALDQTSDILLGAILSGVLEEASVKIISPLVRSFISLQNISRSRYKEFRSLFARCSEGFIDALEDAALTRSAAPLRVSR